MFTGIVPKTQSIKTIDERDDQISLVFSFDDDLINGLKKGASVAVSGTCLTVVSIDGNDVRFDVIKESLDKTVLGTFRVGDSVNIERSFTVGQEIGGHVLSGHVFGTADIVADDHKGDNRTLTFQVPTEWMKYILPKGFIALDGCSLTTVETKPEEGIFTVSFIPETLTVTTFGKKGIGDKVNVEIDAQTQAIVDTVERVLGEKGLAK